MSNVFTFSREEYKVQEKKINGLHVDYIMSNKPNAKSIFFIHGAGVSPVQYFPMMSLLSAYGYNIYAPNLPGHGKNPAISLDRVHIWEYVREIMPICREVKPDIVMGHSMGSIIAQKVAVEYPPKALILLSSIPPYKVHWKIGKPFIRFFYMTLFFIPYFFGWRSLMEWAFNRHFIFTETPKETLKNLQKAFKADGHPGQETPFLTIDVLRKHFTEIKPEHMECPVMVCTGDKDPLMTYETEVKIAKYYDGEIYAQPNSGHVFMIEPGIEDTVAKMQDFLVRKLG